jgi:hypothetical protein
MNDNLYYKKYIKYKNKYNLLKNQINIPLLKNNLIMKGGDKLNFFDNTIGFDSNMLKKQNYKKRFGNFIQSFEDDKIAIIDIIGEDNLNVNNAENIDRNIIIHNYLDSGLDNNYMTNFAFEYLTKVLKNYPDTNLFVSFAPLDIKDFYLPKFLEEFLDSNIDEKLTVIFIGKDYTDRLNVSFSLNMQILNNYLKSLKEKYSLRINLIHVYINFNFVLYDNSEIKLKSLPENNLTTNFVNFLNINYRNEKLNVLYIGFNSCGFIKIIKGIEITDYILIGCDCIKYKNNIIDLPEKNYQNITIYHSNNMSEIIDSNKINYGMIRCVKKLNK